MPDIQTVSPAPSQLEQDVYEIDLLLDYISGRPDKHISSLEGKIQGTSTTAMSEHNIIATYYAYRKAIVEGGLTDAEHAWFVLKLKDVLNTFISPARGLTVAYTLMFSIKYHFFPANPSNRLIIAEHAFPGLIESAEKFRMMKTFLSWACLIITIIGAVLLAQSFYGERLADRYEAAKLKESEASNHLYMAVNSDTSNTVAIHDLSGFCEGISTTGKSSSAQLRTMCDDFSYKHALLCATVHDVGAYSQSRFFKMAKFFFPAHEFGQSACGSDPCKGLPGQQEDAPTLLNMLTLLSNYMLPVLFGISGSLTAFLRGLQEKVRDSILAPRDSALTFIRLPLGIIAGIAVGLFYNSSGSSVPMSVPLGTFTLSSAGVAFLAGYGAEAFFLMLDNLIDKVFRLKEKVDGAENASPPPTVQKP